MHALTGIIVGKNETWNGGEVELKNNAYWKARNILDDFEGDVWDWYTTDGSAGRWSEVYPESVIPATSEEFFNVVEKLVEDQFSNYEWIAKDVRELSGEKLASLYENNIAFHKCDNNLENDEHEMWKTRTKIWSLGMLSDLVLGRFTFDSHIYDSTDGTSAITNRHIETYKEHPEDYYIVLFDVHN